MELATQVMGKGMYGSLVRVSETDEHVYDVAVSPDGKYTAAVLGDGQLVIMNAKTLRVMQRSSMGKSYDNFPSTAVDWLPQKNKDEYDLVSVSSAGGVFVWKWDGEQIERIVRIHEKDNEITCLAVAAGADEFLTAGSNRVVRYYSADGTLKAELCKGYNDDGYPRATHTNRIFSVQFVSPTIAVSAGWGSPVQVWDMRSLESRTQIVGAQIGADGIEPIPNTSCVILTSKRTEQQIQVFDCISGSEVEQDSIRLSSEMANNVPLVSRYCKKTDLLWTITAKPHSVLVFSYSTGKLLASCELPFTLMNIRLSQHFPHQAFISCAKGGIFCATLQV